jgi:hypothetical protein
MGSNSRILKSLTAAQFSSPVLASSTAFQRQLALGLRIRTASDLTDPSRGLAGRHQEAICLTGTMTQIEMLAKAGQGANRPRCDRVVVCTALENISASQTATHDTRFALQTAALTKAQILSLTPLRPRIASSSANRC